MNKNGRKPKEKPANKSLACAVNDEMAERVEEFYEQNNFPTKSKAVLRLVEIGLMYSKCETKEGG